MKKALLVIDMLNDFCSPQGVLSKDFNGGLYAKSAIPLILEKVREALDNRWEVIFICDSHEEDDKEFDRFPSHCVHGTWGGELVASLADLLGNGEKGQFVLKNRYSGFYGTELEELLQDVDEVHVVGVCTNICVLYTVEELCNRDMKVIVYRHGVASFDPDAHEWALKQMESVLGVEIR
ncbi:MAG TPA: cysteine hydrolase [Clostridia bacterium]|nr:cysteine hydrolase [Clostridia bacterium]